MKLTIFLWAVAVVFAMTSCQPCEQKCKFLNGDEIEMIEKSFINNDGQVIDVNRHTDCSCYYTIKYSNMLNFTVEDDFEEFELEEK